MLRDISNLRKSYTQNSLDEVNLPSSPFILFDNWFNEVKSTNSKSEVNAMTLSTIDSNGYPNARIVLERVNIKDPNYTNSPHIHETYEGRFLQLVKI